MLPKVFDHTKPFSEQTNSNKGQAQALKTQVISDLLDSKPGFLVQRGVLFLALIAVLLILIAWFIRYPEIISANGVLYSINAPKPVLCKTNGKIIKLFVKESLEVRRGDMLGYIESTADHNEVIRLSIIVDSMLWWLRDKPLGQPAAYFPRSYHQLGEIQPSFQEFVQAYLKHIDFNKDGFSNRKKELLLRDKQNLLDSRVVLIKQKEFLEQDLELTSENFAMQEKLADEKIISPADYRNEKSKVLSKKMTIPEIDISLLNNAALRNGISKQIAELDNQIRQEQYIFEQSLYTIKSQIDEWKKKYLVIAPIDGRISFMNFVQENQELKNGQIICFITPANSSYYVEVNIPQEKFGKIKLEQDTQLKFPAYPSEEFGEVEGKIDYINLVPTDSGYLARVVLPHGLMTNYRRVLAYRPGLLVKVNVMTANLRLLQRFYLKAKKGVSR